MTTAPGVAVAIVADGSCLRATIVATRAGQSAADAATSARMQPGVVSVGVPTDMHLDVNDPLRPQQYALDLLKADAVWADHDASGVVIAVVDTGVDASHPDLSGVVLSGYDATGNGDGRADPNGHGTHVAGIAAARVDNGLGIAGFAANAQVLPVRVLGADGSGSSLDVAAGIAWATVHGARVVNLSMGSSVADDHIRVAVANALAAGVVVVASAGNGGNEGSPPNYPAAFPGVIAVAAVDRSSQRAPYSTSGSYVALSAPGSDVVSTWPGGYRILSGTSMAAPYVSAAVALVLASGVSPGDVRSLLVATATDLGSPGRDDATGAGLVNVVAARDRVRPKPPPPTAPPITPTNPPTVPPTTVIPQPAQAVFLRVGASAVGRSGCSSSACAMLGVTWEGFTSGPHSVSCFSDLDVTAFFTYVATSSATSSCYFGYPGRQVWVTVDGVRSNSLAWPSVSNAPPPTIVVPPQPMNTVVLAKGASAMGRSGCSSAACAFLAVTLQGFAGGSHSVSCFSDLDAVAFYTYTTSASATSACYFGFPGRQVWVSVDGVRSNSVGW